MSFGLGIFENGKNVATYFDKYVIDVVDMKGSGKKIYNPPDGTKITLVSLYGIHDATKVKIEKNILSWNLKHYFAVYCVILEKL